MGMIQRYHEFRRKLSIAKQNLKTAQENYKNSPTPENEQAVMEAKQIVFVVIGIYLMASLLPSAITTLNGANQTGWTTAQIALWSVVSIIVIAVIIVKIAE